MLVWIRLHGSELWEAVAEGRVWSRVSWEGPRAVPANLPLSLLLDSGLQGPGWLLSWGHPGTVDMTGDFSAPSSPIALGSVPPGLLPALSWCPLSCPAIPPRAQRGQCTASAVCYRSATLVGCSVALWFTQASNWKGQQKIIVVWSP